MPNPKRTTAIAGLIQNLAPNGLDGGAAAKQMRCNNAEANSLDPLQRVSLQRSFTAAYPL